jgi:hypothetical protein
MKVAKPEPGCCKGGIPHRLQSDHTVFLRDVSMLRMWCAFGKDQGASAATTTGEK